MAMGKFKLKVEPRKVFGNNKGFQGRFSIIINPQREYFQRNSHFDTFLLNKRNFSSNEKTSKNLETRLQFFFSQGKELLEKQLFNDAEMPLTSASAIATTLEKPHLKGQVCLILGYCFLKGEKHQQAETMLKESINKLETTDPIRSALAHSYLSESYFTQKKYSEATNSNREALKILEKINADKSMIAGSKNNLAGNLLAEKKYSEAKTYALEALQYFDISLGKHNPITKNCFSNVAKILKGIGQEEEIKSLQENWKGEIEKAINELEIYAKNNFKEKHLSELEDIWKNTQVKKFDPPGLFVTPQIKREEREDFFKIWKKQL